MIHIFIQCRLKSTRLPGKALFNFFKEPVVERIINISKTVKFKKKIYLLTGNKKNNFFLKKIAKKNNIDIFFGSENNVCSRFYNAINFYKIDKDDYILRLTADNYLIQPSLLNEIVKFSYKSKFEYYYIHPFPHFAGELFSVNSFKNKIYKKKLSYLTKEHVTYNYRKLNSVKMKKFNENFKNINHKIKISLDSINDLIFMKEIEAKYPKLKKYNCIGTLKKITYIINKSKNNLVKKSLIY